MKPGLKKKCFLILIGLLVIAGGYFGYRWYASKNAVAVTPTKTQIVKYGSISSVVTATGTLKAVNTVDVGSNTNGLLKRVYVKQNDSVSTGQILAEIDPEKTNNQLQQAILKAENLKSTYLRTQNMFNRGAVAKQDLETAQLNYELAVKDVEICRKALSDTVITATTNGIVIGEPMSEGQTIGGSNLQTIMTIADLSEMKVVALVDESDVGKIRVGQHAEFTIDAFPYVNFSGTVKIISNSVTIQSSVNYYKVEISVYKNKYDLRPGMTARVSIVTGKNAHALLVPLLAIKESAGKEYVEVKIDGRTEKREVVIGLTDDENAEITSGLKENDVIIIPTAKASTSGDTKKSGSGGGPPPML